MDWGPLAGWIAVLPATVSAGVAFWNAKKSHVDAQDAKQALAYTLRPIFYGDTRSSGRELTDADREGAVTLTLSNLGPFDVTDAFAHVHTDVGREVAIAKIPRVKGSIPGTLGAAQKWEIDLTALQPLREPNDRHTFTVTVRSSDHRVDGAQRWEQQITISRWVSSPSEGILNVYATNEQGEPRMVRKG